MSTNLSTVRLPKLNDPTLALHRAIDELALFDPASLQSLQFLADRLLDLAQARTEARWLADDCALALQPKVAEFLAIRLNADPSLVKTSLQMSRRRRKTTRPRKKAS